MSKGASELQKSFTPLKNNHLAIFTPFRVLILLFLVKLKTPTYIIKIQINSSFTYRVIPKCRQDFTYSEYSIMHPAYKFFSSYRCNLRKITILSYPLHDNWTETSDTHFSCYIGTKSLTEKLKASKNSEIISKHWREENLDSKKSTGKNRRWVFSIGGTGFEYEILKYRSLHVSKAIQTDQLRWVQVCKWNEV